MVYGIAIPAIPLPAPLAASGLFAAVMVARVSRLVAPHSASNDESEGRGRRVTVRAGIARSSMAVNSVSHSDDTAG